MAHHHASETRARILAAAEVCFANLGYDRAGVAKICQRAGVSKGAFYHHFPSKQTVFLVLLDQWLAGLDRELDLAHAAGTDVSDAFLRMAEKVSLVFKAAEGQLPIFVEFWSRAIRDQDTWEASSDYFLRYQKRFADMIAAGVAEGFLRPYNPEVTARMIVSLALGVILQGLLDPHGADWGHILREGIECIFNNLKVVK